MPAVHYYLQSEVRKNITGVSDQLLKYMQSYHWPGDIRELENLIERSVLLATGAVIEDIPLGALRRRIC